MSLDPAKLKVTELRAELSARQLDTRGVKAVLVDRLKKALESENEPVSGVPATNIPVDFSTSRVEMEEEAEQQVASPVKPSSPVKVASPSPAVAVSPVKPASPVKPVLSPPIRAQSPVKPVVPIQQQSPVKPVLASPVRPTSPVKPVTASPVQPTSPVKPAMASPVKPTSPVKPVTASPVQTTSPVKPASPVKSPQPVPVQMQSPVQAPVEPVDATKQDVKEEAMETDEKADAAEKETVQNGSSEIKEEKSEGERRGEKRRRSPSVERHQRRSLSPKPIVENEPDFNEDDVLLDWYNSDLNLQINKNEPYTANPLTDHGFGYIWAGARATYGFKTGKVCFEVKILEHMKVSDMGDEQSPHVVRVGWSTEDTSMQLGEDPLSYGYGGTGRSSTDCKFTDYGKTFQAEDVVGAYLNFEDESVSMLFSVNGESQGVAYTVQYSDLDGKALFPHILSKNCKFSCNFGQLEEPWFPILEGYTFVGKMPLEQRVRGITRPASREECVAIMMVGLPGSGKTTWANEYTQKHPEKKFNILGTNALIDKMKVNGLPRRRNYHGRWDVLIDKCTKCLNTLLDIAYRRRRNYIIDQTNVYSSAQRRKMRGFEGFMRRAVVIVPTDEEYKTRCSKRDKEEGKDVPMSAVLEMKANFRIPQSGETFNEVEFVELQEPEATRVVGDYNQEGQKCLPSSPKRFRHDRDRPRFDRGRPDFRGRGGWSNRGPPYRGGGGRGPWQRGAPRSYGPPAQGYRGGRGGYTPRGGSSSSSSYNRNHGSGGRGWNQSSGGGYGNQGYGSQGWSNQSYGSSNSGGGGWRSYNQQPEYNQGYGSQSSYGQQGYGSGSSWNQQYYGQGGGGGGSSGYYGQQQQSSSSQQPWSQGYSSYNQSGNAGWQGYGQSGGYGGSGYNQQSGYSSNGK